MPPSSSHASAEDAAEQDLMASVLALTHEVDLERHEAILEGGTTMRFSRRVPDLQIPRRYLLPARRDLRGGGGLGPGGGRGGRAR
jgi:hypothetical protein